MIVDSENIGNSTTEPWMTELNAWADAFGTPKDTMPQKNIKLLVKERLDKEKLWLDSIPITNLYLPLTKEYCLSEFAFFLIDDDWEEQSLIDLKNIAGASFLFGLQTTSKRIDKLDVIDGTIICQPDEVKQVMNVFEVPSNRNGNLVPTDFDDLKKAFQFTRPAHFIQSTIIGADRLDRAERAISQTLNQIPKDINVEGLMLIVKTDGDVSLEEYLVISSAIEDRVSEDISLWYGSGVADQTNCLCIEVVYMVD